METPTASSAARCLKRAFMLNELPSGRFQRTSFIRSVSSSARQTADQTRPKEPNFVGVQREAERYMNLTQMGLASVKIISDTVARWREAGHPLRNHSLSSQFEVTPSPAEDDTGSMCVS